MKSSTRIGVSGARPHRNRDKTNPINSEILMFMLGIDLLECCIMNAITSLAMAILDVYKHSVINNM
jgi:hypothetical protein